MAVTVPTNPDPSANSLLGAMPRMSPRQILAVMVGTAAMVAVGVGAWTWALAPDYKVLFGNVSDRDGGAIIASLNTMNVPYKLSEAGGAILVPGDRVHEVRLRLASEGIPKGGVVGFELVDNQKFGATQFQEQVNYQRGLEGELAKSIQSVSAVAAARVHLAIPKASVFLRDQQKPSASVLVSLHTGRTLDRSQVAGIVNLVASSVPELTTANVSVLDQNGNLLSRTGTSEPGGLDPTQLTYVKQIESETIRRITDILEPVVGRENVRVQVTADVDFQRVESVAETYKPNQDAKNAAIRTQQSSIAQTGGPGGVGGVPGALSNQPPAAGVATVDSKPAGTATGLISAQSASTSNSRKDESVAFEVDKTIQHTRGPVGRVKRLSAAVVVNHRKPEGANAKAAAAPLDEKSIQQITALVREAMGYSQERGDTLNVANAAFSQPVRETIPAVSFLKQPENIQMAKDAGKYALFIGLIAYLFFGVLKPMLKKAIESVPEPVRYEPSGGVAAAQLSQQEHLMLARKIAREEPKVVANIVKSWVAKDE